MELDCNARWGPLGGVSDARTKLTGLFGIFTGWGLILCHGEKPLGGLGQSILYACHNGGDARGLYVFCTPHRGRAQR